ncbi:hypothetical protein KKC88_03565 [Patescibacteria group bacterium]|nr:hypothetical protein [Patescibacteria group bacterium]MBU1673549.1 hypothetical protein [Patescibacteria group bacterium]MBU1963627.1 hypothetical protein [Patescibacteria group bacterium]
MEIRKTTKKLAIALIVVVIITSPIIYWMLTPSDYIRAVIVDKTVAKPDYREHLGLIWILNHLKYKNKNNKKNFQEDVNYYGFFPSKETLTYDVLTMPETLPEDTDLIYLTDTYGVYNYDFYTDNVRGERSDIIYGGLEDEEVATIKKSLEENDPLLITEFNSLATPTDEKTSQEMQGLLGIKWTGWIGRFFIDLHRDNEEIPFWMIENWEKQNDAEWEFEGPGIALVHKDDTVLIFREGEEVGPGLISIIFTRQAEERFGVNKISHFYYWFSIIEAPRKNILAEYFFDVTDTGRDLLRQYGLKHYFPAIVQQTYPYRTYYFAGDFVDTNQIPFSYFIAGQPLLKQYFVPDIKGEPSNFFWNVYYPVMKTILDEDVKNYEPN